MSLQYYETEKHLNECREDCQWRERGSIEKSQRESEPTLQLVPMAAAPHMHSDNVG